MRSVPPPDAWRDPQGASTADRLVVTACRLIAEQGEEATSLRAVAETAGCSPALVVHHFGSREGLIEACDRAVVSLLDDALAPLFAGSGDAVASVVGTFLSELADGPVVAYALRSLLAGGRAGSHLFAALLDHARRLDAELTAAGVVRPTDDVDMRAAVLIALDLGMLVLRPHVITTLGIDEVALARRWGAVETELLTAGWLAPPSADQEAP